jgi:hypothetical protein
MNWIEKRERISFEELAIEGLYFVDGALFSYSLTLLDEEGNLPSAFFNPSWLKECKQAKIEFPSGETFDFLQSDRPENGGMVHLFDSMYLPYYDTRDTAWERVDAIGQQEEYQAHKHGDDQLELIGYYEDDHFISSLPTIQRSIVWSILSD